MAELLIKPLFRPYLFLDIIIWKKLPINDCSLLIKLHENYKMITCTTQLDEVKRHLFNKYPNIIESLIELTPDEEEQELSELVATHKEFVNQYKKFLKIITNNFILNIKPTEQNILDINTRILENKAPFTTNTYIGDILLWECIINHIDIPDYSELHIYTKSNKFMRGNKLHPFLSFEWKVKKHGLLLLYTTNYVASKKSQQHQLEKINRKLNKLSPEYMKKRFRSIELLLDNNFKYLDKFDKQDNLTLLRELKYLYSRLSIHLSSGNLSRYSLSYKKYKELFKKYIKNKN